MSLSKSLLLVFAALLIIVIALYAFKSGSFLSSRLSSDPSSSQSPSEVNGGGLEKNNPHPLSIQALREGVYPGSTITIEQTLEPGSNYQRYIASYKSEGLTIYALLTVPNGEKPESGWPVVIFNHGYIPPDQYRTTERYIAYTDAFSRNGYIVFRSDYRGHGNSEGRLLVAMEPTITP